MHRTATSTTDSSAGDPDATTSTGAPGDDPSGTDRASTAPSATTASATTASATTASATAASAAAASHAAPTSTGGRVRRAVLRVLRHLVLPVAVTAALTVGISRGLELAHVQTEPFMDPDERWEMLPPRLFELGAYAVWPFVALLLALTGSLWATAILGVAAGALIAVADDQKMALRSEPLFPSDVEYLAHPGLLLASADVSTPLVLGAVALVVAALAAVALLSWRHRRRHPRSRTERWFRWGSRAVFAAAGVAGVVVLAGFHDPGNPLREAYEDVPVTWAQWNQAQNYAQNGFVAGALFNVPGVAMERPEGYGEDRMAEIVATYEQAAAEANASRRPGALDGTNVVIILGETFTDPTNLAGVVVEEDPIPFTRSLMSATPSGTMLSSGYGGGTANVEFEVLTGMTVAQFQPQMSAPYPMLVANHASFPSVVDRLGAGRETLAIHPYSRTFYRRDVVYPALGFDRRTFWDTIGHRDQVGDDQHISDAATYRELLDELRNSEEPLLVNVVTMQNHSPYLGTFPDPIGVGGVVAGDDAEVAGQYLRGLRYSDDAMAELVEELEALDERTVVLFYGDHLPAMWPQEVLAANSTQALRETPWFVWANFEVADVDAPSVLGPPFLIPQLLAAAEAPLTPYDALLAELSEVVAADEGGILLDADGRRIREGDIPSGGREVLEDYRLVQYDLSVGSRHSLEAMTTVP